MRRKRMRGGEDGGLPGCGMAGRLALSRSEVAGVLGVSLGTLDSMLRAGRLPAIRISHRRVVVPLAAVEALLAGGAPR